MSDIPSKIALHRKRAELELQYGDEAYCLGAEFLRVHSPSAEVQGHGPGQKKIPLNKSDVQIERIEAQGNYAIRLFFDDGHSSGIYTWTYLRELAVNHTALWQTYLQESQIEQQKLSGEQAIKWIE